MMTVGKQYSFEMDDELPFRQHAMINLNETPRFQVETPSKVYLEYGYLKTKPFYRETWFVVALAAASIVIIIMVVAILCVKSKTYKYKGKAVVTPSCRY